MTNYIFEHMSITTPEGERSLISKPYAGISTLVNLKIHKKTSPAVPISSTAGQFYFKYFTKYLLDLSSLLHMAV